MITTNRKLWVLERFIVDPNLKKKVVKKADSKNPSDFTSDKYDGVFLNPAHHDNTPCLSFLNREGQYVSISCGVKRFEVISLKKTTVDPSTKPKVKKK